MVVIVGWGDSGSKSLGPVAPAVCPNCHNDVFMHHVRSTKTLSLFFVPLGDYSTQDYLACPTCQHAAMIAPAQKQRVANMRAATVSFRQGRVPEDYYRQTVDAFWRAIGIDPRGQQVIRPTKTTAPAKPPLAEQLKGLAELVSQGVLTEQEFAAAKKKLLDS